MVELVLLMQLPELQYHTQVVEVLVLFHASLHLEEQVPLVEQVVVQEGVILQLMEQLEQLLLVVVAVEVVVEINLLE
jgi:hypothetical protein